MNEEIWKPIPGYDGYEASSLGRIRSIDRVMEFTGRWGVPWRRRHKGRVLRIKSHPNGWGGVYQIFHAAGGATVYVNRAVCAAFNGPPPSAEHEAAHLNGQPEINLPGNLVWATPKENAAHKIDHGTNPLGGRNGCAVLTDAIVPLVFEAFLAGETAATIAKRIGVTVTMVSRILRRQAWKHVPIPESMIYEAILRARENVRAAAARNNARRRQVAIDKDRASPRCGPSPLY
jgi:NUMOD4 motif/HNH endonuclease